MYSSFYKISKRTKETDLNRYEYLRQLVNEFHTTESLDAKRQVLANLSNFLYDPINYGYLRDLNIFDILFNELESSDPKLVEFAVGGICNSCLDPQNRIIIEQHGFDKLVSCLNKAEDEIIISTLTILIYLSNTNNLSETNLIFLKSMSELFLTASNVRIKNLAIIYFKKILKFSE